MSVIKHSVMKDTHSNHLIIYGYGRGPTCHLSPKEVKEPPIETSIFAFNKEVSHPLAGTGPEAS